VRDAAVLRQSPSEQSEAIAQLSTGTAFAMLDNSLGWAWGYAGEDRLVGYVRAEALGL
jgi:hypothetical protein